MMPRATPILALAAAVAALLSSRPVDAHLGLRIDDGLTARAKVGPGDDATKHLVFVGEPPAGLSERAMALAIDGAVRAWDGVTCSTARLTFDGARRTTDDVGPGEIPMLFVDAFDDPCFPIKDNVGFTLYGACDADGDGVDDYPVDTVLLNTSGFRWRAEPAPYQDVDVANPLTVDARSVVTHELGHVLGLSHTLDDRLATMSPNYLPDGGLATLSATDKLALCARYPSGKSECANVSECPDPFGTCRISRGTGVCEEERGEPGDYCTTDHLICSCHVTSASTHSGYCTTSCDADADCPEGWTCADQDTCRMGAPEDPGCSTAAVVDPAPLSLLLAWTLFARLSRR